MALTNEQVFRWFFVLIFLATFSISAYYRRRARQSDEAISRMREGRFTMLARALLAAALFIPFFAYMLNPVWMHWASLPLPNWLRWIGVAVGIAVLPMIDWVMRSIGKNVSETALTKESHELVSHGPYRWVRHPLYMVATIGFVSLSIVASNWFMLAIALIAFGAIALCVVPKEEAELLRKFGIEYQKYQRNTGRFTPRLRR